MKPSEIVAFLRTNNPFVTNSVGDPWHDHSPDVPAIYESEFNQILDLIRQKRATPYANFACLVTGEAGSGKTHLIRRILSFRKAHTDISFAYIQPLENHQSPFDYLLKEIVTNLTRPLEENGLFSQLDRIVGVLFQKILSELPETSSVLNTNVSGLKKDPLTAFNPKISSVLNQPSVMDFGQNLMEVFDNQIDPRFLKVVLSFLNKTHKKAAVKWLKNAFLDDDERQALGLSPENDQTHGDLENRSKAILRSLGILLAYTGHTMVLCFDRLENLDLTEQLKALGKCLEYFVDVTQSFLPLVFYRGEFWERIVKDAFNQQIITRLEANRIELQGCSKKQAYQIVRARLSNIISDKDSMSITPISEEVLAARFIGEITLPRKVVSTANQLLKEFLYQDKPLKVLTPQEFLRERYFNIFRSKSDAPDSYNPDGMKMLKALTHYLGHFPSQKNIRFDLLSYTKKNYGALFGFNRREVLILGEMTINQHPPFKILIVVDDSEDGRSVSAVLRRSLGFLAETPNSAAFYVRDFRKKFLGPDKWKSANKYLQAFTKAGGHNLILNQEWSAGIHALVEIHYQIGARSLTYTSQDGSLCEVDTEQYFNFIETELHQSDYPCFFYFDSQLSDDKQILSGKTDITSPTVDIEEPENSAEQTEISTDPPLSERSDDPQLNQLIETLATQGLVVEPLEPVDSCRFTRYRIKPVFSKGTTVQKIKRQSENLQVELGLESPPFIQAGAGFVSIDVPKEKSLPLLLKNLIKTRKRVQNDTSLSFPLGMTINNKVFWADFSDPNMSSMLVGGSSGSGKSVFLKAIAVGLGMRYTRSDLRLILIDPKRVSFTDIMNIPQLSTPIIMDNERALEALSQLSELMEKRYRTFSEKNVVDIIEYNQKYRKLPRYVILIDEYADLMMEKKASDQLVKAIQRIGQKGRAAGIHLVLSTQRPDSKVITPLIKANLQLKIALKVTSVANSNIILDQPGAECLLGKGDMLVGGSVTIQRIQGPMVYKISNFSTIQRQGGKQKK